MKKSDARFFNQGRSFGTDEKQIDAIVRISGAERFSN